MEGDRSINEPGEGKTQDSQIALEKYQRERRKQSAQNMLLGIGFVCLHLAFFFVGKIGFFQMFRSLLFVLGVVILGFSAWQFRRAKSLTERDWVEHEQAKSFANSLKKTKLYYTWVLLACLVVVALCQPVFEAKNSIQAAGLVKSLVWQGEWWRLFTCTTLHADFLHILLNGLSLVQLGRMTESTADRAHLSLVYLVSAISGSMFSLFLIPNVTSVGASGGLMGLVGFLTVLGVRRKNKLPPGYLKSMVIANCFIGAVGLVGVAIIDNAAHFGGVAAGIVCGNVLIRTDNGALPVGTNRMIRNFGRLSLLISIGISLVSIVMIFRLIP